MGIYAEPATVTIIIWARQSTLYIHASCRERRPKSRQELNPGPPILLTVLATDVNCCATGHSHHLQTPNIFPNFLNSVQGQIFQHLSDEAAVCRGATHARLLTRARAHLTHRTSSSHQDANGGGSALHCYIVSLLFLTIFFYLLVEFFLRVCVGARVKVWN